ncbi:MAG TPA: SDR family oxidoreductase, partial [Sphingomicrobium sp.]|nr:SDR family oxidoreductase [Sphingomicrobium sp.]
MAGSGRRALVLGASSPGGIGEAVARRLAREGYSLILAGRRRSTLDALADEMGATALTCDVTDEDSVAAMFDAAGPR